MRGTGARVSLGVDAVELEEAKLKIVFALSVVAFPLESVWHARYRGGAAKKG